ncbi:MAG: glycine zipper 2TM domain-containing protein [Magnetococcales bacterium]|nr:glycine zipper 2TM domain-containing protein [Magnetococcales bacterium]
MRRTTSFLAATAFVGALLGSSWAVADGAEALGGMVTGALVGSIFGPDKKHRGQNALIGAVAGGLIGSQINTAPAYAAPAPVYAAPPPSYTVVERGYYEGPRHHHRGYTTTVIEQAPVQTVVVERYAPAPRTVYVEEPTRSYVYSSSPRY